MPQHRLRPAKDMKHDMFHEHCPASVLALVLFTGATAELCVLMVRMLCKTLYQSRSQMLEMQMLGVIDEPLFYHCQCSTNFKTCSNLCNGRCFFLCQGSTSMPVPTCVQGFSAFPFQCSTSKPVPDLCNGRKRLPDAPAIRQLPRPPPLRQRERLRSHTLAAPFAACCRSGPVAGTIASR